MDGISNRNDVRLFLSFYQSQRSDKIVLNSLDIESGCLIEKTYPVNVYDKIYALERYLLTRDYDIQDPLTGFELRINGFDDLLGSLIPSGIYVTDWLHNDLDLYQIQDDTIIAPNLLSSRLSRIEMINAVKRHLKIDVRYKYSQNNDDFNHNKENRVRCFTEFMQFANKLKKMYPYIDIVISDYVFNEFFPKVYICVCGRPYVKFSQANMGVIFSDVRGTPDYGINDNFYEYNECKLWDYHKGGYSVKRSNTLIDTLNYLFNVPVDFEYTKRIIKELGKEVFSKDIDNAIIYFDWVKNCYFFDPETENIIFGEGTKSISNDDYFCKYTSLDTLIAVLKSGNMRLNSIVGMNDPTETLKLKGEGCNYLRTDEEQEEILKYANYYYITSFTKNQDDLNMWRFYGEKGTGVCMVFKPIKDQQEDVFNVNYLPLKSEILKRLETFLSVLEKKGIRFSIQSYVDKYLFIKPKEFEVEQERRLVMTSAEPTDFAVYSNNIITPYIDRKLPYDQIENQSDSDDYFPLRLCKIVLGPEMKNKEENKRQIEFMLKCKQSRFYDKIEVEISKINCYRN